MYIHNIRNTSSPRYSLLLSGKGRGKGRTRRKKPDGEKKIRFGHD